MKLKRNVLEIFEHQQTLLSPSLLFLTRPPFYRLTFASLVNCAFAFFAAPFFPFFYSFNFRFSLTVFRFAPVERFERNEQPGATERQRRKDRRRRIKRHGRTGRVLYSDIYWRGKGTVYNRILSRLSRSPIFHQLSYSFFSAVFPRSASTSFLSLARSSRRSVVLLIIQSVWSQGDEDENEASKATLSISTKIQR